MILGDMSIDHFNRMIELEEKKLAVEMLKNYTKTHTTGTTSDYKDFYNIFLKEIRKTKGEDQ